MDNDAVDDDNVIDDGISQEKYETEPSQGEAAAGFSARAQRDRFLGGATEGKGSATIFNLSLTDMNPGGGLVAEKRTALLDQSRQLLGTSEFQELGLKYRLRHPVADTTRPDIQAEISAAFSEYVIGSLDQ